MNDAGVVRRPIAMLVTVLAAVAMLPLWSGGSEPLGRVIGTNVLLLATILVWLQPTVRRLGWRSPLVIWGLALLGWAALSLIWSINRYETELWLVSLVGAYAAFMTAYHLAGAARLRWWLLRAYLVVATLSSIYGLWIFFSDGYNRLTSAFFWPNPMAGFLLPAIIFGLDYVSGRGRARWLYVATAINLVAFWLTQSRGATLVLILAALGLIWRYRRHRRYWLTVIATSIVTIIVSTICVQLWHIGHKDATVSTISSRFSSASSTDDMSTSSRLDFLASSGDIWLAHPFEGSGAGTYASLHPAYQKRVVSAASDAHNWYVQSLAELGLVGGLIVVALVVTLLRGLWRGGRADPTVTAWVIGTVALMVHLGLDIDGQYPVILIALGLLLGCLWRPADPERDTAGRSALALPIVLVGALTLASAANQSHLLASQADAAQATGDLAASASLYLKAHQTLVYDPSLIEAEGIDYYSLALQGKDRDANLALALDRANDAIAAAPTGAQNYQLKGRVYLAQKQDATAEAVLRRALVYDPYNQPSYAQDLAVSLAGQQRLAEARRVTQTMLAQYPQVVLKNRSASSATINAVYQLWLYQQYLDNAMGDHAAEAIDRSSAAAVAALL